MLSGRGRGPYSTGFLYTVKKVSDFPVQDVTNETLPGRESLSYSPGLGSFVNDIPAGDVKIANLFLQCICP
jgi:hypothetical protein